MKRKVFDGKTVFDDYYFENGKIVSKGIHEPHYYVDRDGRQQVTLYHNNIRYVRSLQNIKKWSIPEIKLQKLLKRVKKDFVPVFGHENEYMFNLKNPFEVYSIRTRKILRIIKTQRYFQVGIKTETGNNLYIHKMVAEYHYQKFIDTNKYEIHHLSHNPAECNIENLVILPSTIHKEFETCFKRMVKGKMTKEEVITMINKFDILALDKKKLIKSLNVNAKTKKV